jgi:hypothetical protein
MGRFNCFMNGAILGAGALYFFDPQLGRRRRALLEDQLRHFSRRATDGLDAALCDLQNRAQGTVAELQHLVSKEEVSDEVLCERIRSLAGRYLSNASALNVDVSDGCVCLSGQALAHEAGPLVHAVRMARGVCRVDNQLEMHESAGKLSALQGARSRSGKLPELLQANWAPGTRLVAGAAGSFMMLNCLVSRSITSKLWGLLGFALTSRAMATPTTMGGLKHHRGFTPPQSSGSSPTGGHESRQGWSPTPTPWPQARPLAPASGDTASSAASSGRMSSGNEDRADVWPHSRETASQQSGTPGPFSDL